MYKNATLTGDDDSTTHRDEVEGLRSQYVPSIAKPEPHVGVLDRESKDKSSSKVFEHAVRHTVSDFSDILQNLD